MMNPLLEVIFKYYCYRNIAFSFVLRFSYLKINNFMIMESFFYILVNEH